MTTLKDLYIEETTGALVRKLMPFLTRPNQSHAAPLRIVFRGKERAEPLAVASLDQGLRQELIDEGVRCTIQTFQM